MHYYHYHSDELTIVVIAPQASREIGRLYEAELRFKTGILAGLTITGFSVYQDRDTPDRFVTLPCRLLRPSNTENVFAMADAQAHVHTAILDAVAAYESSQGQPQAALAVAGF